jgi:hypothetical protein
MTSINVVGSARPRTATLAEVAIVTASQPQVATTSKTVANDNAIDAKARETERKMTDDERFSLIISIAGFSRGIGRDKRYPQLAREGGRVLGREARIRDWRPVHQRGPCGDRRAFSPPVRERGRLARAAALAKFCDVAVIVVGYTYLDEGEFIDAGGDGPWNAHFPKQPVTADDEPFARGHFRHRHPCYHSPLSRA